jgi:hypothetical protein
MYKKIAVKTGKYSKKAGNYILSLALQSKPYLSLELIEVE